MNTTDQIIIENLVNRIEKMEKKLRSLTELRYTPATKKELRDYIDWSAQQKERNQKIFNRETD